MEKKQDSYDYLIFIGDLIEDYMLYEQVINYHFEKNQKGNEDFDLNHVVVLNLDNHKSRVSKKIQKVEQLI